MNGSERRPACRRSIQLRRKPRSPRMHEAIHAGFVRACHDLSEGGLAVAAAEMAFAGGLGAPHLFAGSAARREAR